MCLTNNNLTIKSTADAQKSARRLFRRYVAINLAESLVEAENLDSIFSVPNRIPLLFYAFKWMDFYNI